MSSFWESVSAWAALGAVWFAALACINTYHRLAANARIREHEEDMHRKYEAYKAQLRAEFDAAVSQRVREVLSTVHYSVPVEIIDERKANNGK